MKAIVISRLGGPDGLEIREIPKPEPASGQEVVRVEAGDDLAGVEDRQREDQVVEVTAHDVRIVREQDVARLDAVGAVEREGRSRIATKAAAGFLLQR